MTVCAAKTIASSIIELMQNDEQRLAAKREFEERTGGGIGGSKWLAPLCDYDPPVNLRWPEYVETRRGREWWMPTAGY